MPNTITRKIYFYRADVGRDQAGTPIPFDPIPILRHIDGLDWNARRRGRYWTGDDGRITCCWVDDHIISPKLRFGYSRRAELPLIEEGGQLSPLEISESSGLAEQIHVVFFENNIIGADFNFYGPRLPRLAYYFANKGAGISPPTLYFDPLLRQDMLEQLRRLGHIRLFRMRIRSSYAETIERVNHSLGEAFRAAREVGGAEEVEIVLKPGRFSHGWLDEGLLHSAADFLGLPGLRNEASAFTVRGFDKVSERIVELDLLNDKLIASRRIMQLGNRSRALDSQSAYWAIEDAFDELKEDLLRASSIEP